MIFDFYVDNEDYLMYKQAMKEMSEANQQDIQNATDSQTRQIQESADRFAHLDDAYNESTSNQFNDYKHDVLTSLMETGLNKLFVKCLGRVNYSTLSENTKTFARSLVANFVNEETVESLIESFRNKTPLLAELVYTVESAAAAILEEADNDDPTSFVTSKEEENFFEEIDGDEDINDLCDIIRTRVTADSQDFMDTNRMEKYEILATMQDSQEKTEQQQTGDEELDAIVAYENAVTADELRQEILDRPHGILEAMFRSMSQAIIKDEALREQYSENGVLNNDDIYEKVLTRYTFTEMVSALRIKDIDENFLMKEVL